MTKPIIQEGDKIIFKKDFDKVDTNVTGFTDDQKEYEGKEAIVEEVTFTIEGDRLKSLLANLVGLPRGGSNVRTPFLL